MEQDFKFFNKTVQILAKLSLKSISTPAQPQLNSISSQPQQKTTELGTTQLKLVIRLAIGSFNGNETRVGIKI